MVRPYDFGFNPETALDNEFQHPTELPPEEVIAQAQAEFDAMVKHLQNHQIEILVLDLEMPQNTPDALFPNNWFSTAPDGSLTIYPMKTENRRREVKLAELLRLLKSSDYEVSDIHDLRPESVDWPDESILEGTGSLVFHHDKRLAFAAISERCQRTALQSFCERFDYEMVAFDTKTLNGSAIYHTNVVMSIGERISVICTEVIPESQRATVIEQLKCCSEEVIEITESQMAEHFCGNILQVRNTEGKPVFIMSASTHAGFTPEQKRILESYGQLLACDISLIESIGGGSARCMLAENFLKHMKRLDKEGAI